MQVFVNTLVAQCERHKISAELLLVEWNPPADRPRLATALAWPVSQWCEIRIVEVPAEVHARFEHSDRLPLFQMIAKNIGIRRARGEYVLATNIDLVFSDELMADIASRRLRADRLYRVDRHDVDALPDPSLPLEDVLAICRDNVIRICARVGTHDVASGAFYRIYDDRRLPLVLWIVRYIYRATIWKIRGALNFCRRVVLFFMLRARSWSKSIWVILRYAAAWMRYSYFAVQGRAALRPQRLSRSARPESVQYRPHLRRGWRLPSLAGAYGRLRQAAEAERVRIRLHTNASGDFTLLSRAGWYATRAYPELEMFSMHLDGLFLYQAHYAGYREELLQGPAFHIEHTHGFKPEPKEVQTLNTRLERAAIPQVTMEQFSAWSVEMYRAKAPLPFNGEGWGLAADDLPEIVQPRPYTEAMTQ
jgi:hypothetical protein